MDLVDLAKRVRRGVKLLDKKVPGWRRIMRSHRHEFSLRHGDYCVLGTLEHHSRQMQSLNARRAAKLIDENGYGRGVERLNIIGSAYGFDITDDEGKNPRGEYEAMQDLWIAEFSE